MIISENDYKAVQNALESLSEYTLVRILGDYKIVVEVTTAPNVWGNTDADSGKAMVQERVQYQKLCKRGGNEVVSINVAYNMDCMEAMRQMPDKCFDLAVVDPPYGIDKASTATSRVAKYGQLKTVNDSKPTEEYFEQLFRVSKNQIVFGYNHLSDMLPPTKEFLFWYKHQPVDTYSDGELAWTSYQKTAKCFDYPFFGTCGADSDGRIHPAQKPIALYAWIFQNYAKPGYKILDTHLGSGSSRIAAYDAGLDFVGYEIDKDYFDKQEERFAAHTAQYSLFVK